MKNTQRLKEKLFQYLSVVRNNAPIAFVIFLVAIYGFLAWRISQLLQAEPNASAVSAQLQNVGVPKVDPDVVNKMQQLKDNNVSVKSLFDDARSNPFQE